MSARIKRLVRRYIPTKYKQSLKEQYSNIQKSPVYISLRKPFFKVKRKVVKTFFSYTPLQLEQKFREIGLKPGDTVFLHSAFHVFNGFDSSPQRLIDCVLNVIESSGNLLMMSIPYEGTTYDYLTEGRPFDVKRTASCMGVVTEIFRRQKNVLRSLNPAHPVLAYGPHAAWLIADHEKTMYSCGKDSPFEKALELDGKALFFDVGLQSMTFYHYIEYLFRDLLQINLYHDEPLEGIVYDDNRNEIRVKTYVLRKETGNNPCLRIRLYRSFEKELIKTNLLKIDKIGNVKLILVHLQDVVNCAQEMVASGRLQAHS